MNESKDAPIISRIRIIASQSTCTSCIDGSARETVPEKLPLPALLVGFRRAMARWRCDWDWRVLRHAPHAHRRTCSSIANADATGDSHSWLPLKLRVSSVDISARATYICMSPFFRIINCTCIFQTLTFTL